MLIVISVQEERRVNGPSGSEGIIGIGKVGVTTDPPELVSSTEVGNCSGSSVTSGVGLGVVGHRFS